MWKRLKERRENLSNRKRTRKTEERVGNSIPHVPEGDEDGSSTYT